MSDPSPAVVVVAHDRPVHFRRLIDAIQPLPSFVHIDANTPPDVHAAMVRDLPDTVTLLPRLRAGWARQEVLEAELSGYRAALEATDAEHFILLTGADYPLASTATIAAFLGRHPGHSFAEVHLIPRAGWGPTGGADRFWFRQWPWRRHRMVLPLPRRRPSGVVRAAGSQSKILCRAHARYVLDLLEARPDLWDYFRRCWAPDEVTIHSLLMSGSLGGPWGAFDVRELELWYTDWGDAPSPSPRWLTAADLPRLEAARSRSPYPALFARKFDEDDTALPDLIDTTLRTCPIPFDA